MKKIIVTILTTKIALFLLIFLAYSLLPFSKLGYYYNFHFPITAPITLQTAFSTWDGQHYLFLAQKGYHVGEESNRFYPLLPSLIRLFSPIFGVFFSGLFVTNVLSFVGCIYFYLFVREFTKHEKAAYISLLLLLIFPTSFYFSLIYSEGIFLGIVMPLFYYMLKKRFLYASLCAFLLPLTRPTGILIVVPLIIYCVSIYWQDIKEQKQSFMKLKLQFSPTLFLPVVSLFGAGLYFIIMYKTTGNIMTGLASQNSVVGHWQISALFHPNIFIQNIFPKDLAIHGFTNSLIDRIFFTLFLVSLPVIWKKTNLFLFSYALIMGMVPLFGSFMSYTRYVLLAVPLFIAVGIVFSEENKKQYLSLSLYCSLVLQTLFVIMHALNYWVA